MRRTDPGVRRGFRNRDYPQRGHHQGLDRYRSIHHLREVHDKIRRARRFQKKSRIDDLARLSYWNASEGDEDRMVRSEMQQRRIEIEIQRYSSVDWNREGLIQTL